MLKSQSFERGESGCAVEDDVTAVPKGGNRRVNQPGIVAYRRPSAGRHACRPLPREVTLGPLATTCNDNIELACSALSKSAICSLDFADCFIMVAVDDCGLVRCRDTRCAVRSKLVAASRASGFSLGWTKRAAPAKRPFSKASSNLSLSSKPAWPVLIRQAAWFHRCDLIPTQNGFRFCIKWQM